MFGRWSAFMCAVFAIELKQFNNCRFIQYFTSIDLSNGSSAIFFSLVLMSIFETVSPSAPLSLSFSLSISFSLCSYLYLLLILVLTIVANDGNGTQNTVTITTTLTRGECPWAQIFSLVMCKHAHTHPMLA